METLLITLLVVTGLAFIAGCIAIKNNGEKKAKELLRKTEKKGK